MAGHGGAWKVAFADFMTAMMALFLVLWISAQDKKILIATSRYFQSPFSSPMEDHSGVMPFNKESNNNSAPKTDTDGATSKNSSDKQVELSYLNSVAAEFFRLLHLEQNQDEKPLDIQVTSDGLRITLFDRSRQPLFKDDSAELTDWGVHLMQSLAWLIDRHQFHVTIDGHTRQGLTLPREEYSPWELSADRANAARRKLVYYAVEPALIERVTGYADTKPLPKEDPKAESNQRITLSLALGHGGKDRDKPKTAAKAPPVKSRAPAGEPQFALPNETGSSSPALKSESDVAASARLH